jgi:hypothetical protein
MKPIQSLKRIFAAALILVLVLAACSPASIPDTGGESTPDNLPPLVVMEAITQLSQELNVSMEVVEVIELEQVDWPDACLGIPMEGQACAQVITPGFRVVLDVNGQQYEFRSNQDGTLLMQVPDR